MRKKVNKKNFLAVLLALCMTLAHALPAGAEELAWQASEETVRILLLGNSFTGRNNLAGTIQKIAAKKGRKVEVKAIAKGKANLAQFTTKGTRPYRKLQKALKRKRWDYVILQDRHAYPLMNVEGMKKAAVQLCKTIRKAGAEPMLYMTWAPEDGHRDYKRFRRLVKDRYDYQEKIASVYEYLSDVTGAPVIPVGLAFQEARDTYPGIRLNDVDKYHPSRYGTYLAACTIYSSLFLESPEGEDSGKAPARTAERLQRTACKTWMEYRY